MRMNKCAYLFAAALVASTVGMTSCSNEEVAGIENIQGQQSNVTMGLSVKGAGSRAAADMNFANPTAITNVAVVPFVGTAPQKPIQWASVTSTTDPKTVQMVNTVNSFKVYGNLSVTQYAKTLNAYTLTDEDFALSVADGPIKDVNKQDCYNPHTQLYYFKNATSFKRATTGTDWASASYGTDEEGVIGSAKFIKISDVNYAVGTFVAAIMNGDETACFYSDADLTGPAKTAADAGVKVSGIMIEGQKDFDVNLTVKGDDKTVYEKADKEGAFASDKVTGTSDALDKGNIFVIVSPSDENKEINANIEFTLPANTYLKLTSGDKIGGESETKFYLAVKMKTAKSGNETGSTYNVNRVFAADYVTILNATVKNWGIATDEPSTVSDAQIGVEFDVTWKSGNIYDVEI